MEPSPLGSDLSMPPDERDHVRGPADAPVTIVEYGDYECATCARTHPIIQRLLRDSAGQLRFVFRHFPLNSVHRHAGQAAQAAEAAGNQGRFWEMHDVMFDHIDELADTDLSRYALKVGLEIYGFEADLSSGRLSGRVERDRESGLNSGVSGTPAIFINGARHVGQITLESLRDAVREAEGR